MTFPKDTDAAIALKTGKVDAYFGDSPVVAYYIEKRRTSVRVRGTPVNPIPVGIAMRKGDPLIAKVQKAVERDVRGRHDAEDPREVEDERVRPEEVAATRREERRMLAAFDWDVIWDRIFHPDQRLRCARSGRRSTSPSSPRSSGSSSACRGAHADVALHACCGSSRGCTCSSSAGRR